MRLTTLVEAARAGADDGSRSDRSRVRAKLAARLKAAAGEGAEHPRLEIVTNVRSRRRPMPRLLMVAAAILLVGSASALGARHVARERDRAGDERAAWAALAPVPSPPSAPAPAPEEPVSKPNDSAALPELVARGASSASTPRRPPSAAHPAALDAEMALVQEAREALRRGDPAAALRALGHYDETFRAGVLRPEAAALRVFALCDSGRVEEARARGAAFARQWPRSPLIARLRASCAAGGPP